MQLPAVFCLYCFNALKLLLDPPYILRGIENLHCLESMQNSLRSEQGSHKLILYGAKLILGGCQCYGPEARVPEFNRWSV